MKTPAMRYLDLNPIELEGESLFSLSDPDHVVDETLLLTTAGAFIAMHLDGHHSIPDIQAKAKEQFGDIEVPSEAIEEIIKQLDEFGFLNTAIFDEKYATLREDFRTRPTRPAFLAGKSYPDDPDELRAFLDEQFTREGSTQQPLADTPGDGLPLRGLIAPHIDIPRGGHSYSHAYAALHQSGTPDTVFIFGVAHHSEAVPFILTRHYCPKHAEIILGA